MTEIDTAEACYRQGVIDAAEQLRSQRERIEELEKALAGCIDRLGRDPFVRFTVKGQPAGWRLGEMRAYLPISHPGRTGTYLFLLTGPVLLDQDPDEVARLVHEAEDQAAAALRALR